MFYGPLEWQEKNIKSRMYQQEENIRKVRKENTFGADD